jgi:hypothetical protein
MPAFESAGASRTDLERTWSGYVRRIAAAGQGAANRWPPSKLFAADGVAAPPHLRERLHPGGYQCAPHSTTHRSSHTVNGCTVSIGASQQNAMLPWTR